MKKEMLINVLQPEECRIAIVEDGVLEELYVERTSHENYTGNIYKGKVVNLEPAIQAAFVDFSVGRNGFLHVSDVEPQYYRKLLGEDDDLPTRDRVREPRSASSARDEAPRAPREHRDEPRAPREHREPREPRDEPRAPRGSRSEERGRGRGGEDRGRRSPDRTSRSSEITPPGDLSHFGEPPSLPPQLEDRRPKRERDLPDSWDPDLSWDRPDRSEKPRKDRRFGEGLLGEWDDQPHTPPARPAASPSHRRPPSLEPLNPEPAEPPVAEPRPEPSFSAQGEASPVEPIESALPPSRTDRGRRPRPARPLDEPQAPRTADAWDSFGPAEPPPAPPSLGSPDEPPGRPAQPRGRRGRTPRTDRHAPGSSVPPEGTDNPAEFPFEVQPRIESLIAFEAELETIEDRPTQPRGRDAIRARGGDRPAGRPRDRDRDRGDRERPRSHDTGPTERPRAGEPLGGWGAQAELPPAAEREPRPARERDIDADSPPTRSRPHGRAGEPGYVPRRERSRGPAEPGSPGRPVSEWTTPAPEGPLPGPDDDESGKPRRRRRRRRTDREPRAGSALSRPELYDDLLPNQPEESGIDFDDEESPLPPPRSTPSAPRRPLGPAAMRARTDDLDDLHPHHHDDDDDFHEGEHGSSEFDHEPLHDEEIDPELEEEIRREIEEIQILEREMGLRGTTEARPRRGDDPEAPSRPGDRTRGRGPVKPPIQDVFRRGDEVLIQVIKESIGTKGPTLSTYISIPGRYLVLMPGLNRVGVSRKIADEGQRRRLREIMHALNPPKGLGFIVRTAGLDRTKRELARDLAYLLRLWKVILRRIKKTRSPAPIYQESDMIIRTIRDIFTAEIDTIWIDEPSAYERAVEFMKVVMPKHVDRIKLYDERVPLFHKYGLEEEIAKIQRRRVDLPGGGSIVIDQTEALVAIDVNSGNFRVEDDAEKTAYEMNLRAAKEIARQLRLRDLGGVIVNDFIDMREEKHRRGVERAVREAVKRDRARTKILRMSQFGLVEMTRQRIRPSLKRSVYEDCPHCTGAGVVKTAESMAIDVMRLLALVAHRADIRRVHLSVAPGVATYLNNRKRREIAQIEAESNLLVVLRHQEAAAAEHLSFECFDAQNNEIRLFPAPAAPSRRGSR